MKIKVRVGDKILERAVYQRGKTPYVRANGALYEVLWKELDTVFNTNILFDEGCSRDDDFDHSSDRDVVLTSFQSRDLIRNIAKAYHHTGTRFEDRPESEKWKYHGIACILNMIAATIEGTTDYSEKIMDDLRQVRLSQGDWARPICTEVSFEHAVSETSLWSKVRSIFK